jgi:hypothetical protein
LDVAVSRPAGPDRVALDATEKEYDMQHEYVFAMVFDARQHELEEQARHARLVAQARQKAKPRRSTRSLPQLWLRASTLAGRFRVNVEEPA